MDDDLSYPVVIVDYNPHWPAQFRAEWERLRPHVAPPVIAAEHIGSTAVPGLCGKPIVDLLLGVPAPEDLDQIRPVIEAASYIYVPYLAEAFSEARFYRRETGAFHLHLTVVGSYLWQRHLRWRDLLRTDSDLAPQYGELKRRLASEPTTATLAMYRLGKAPFIRDALARVMAEG